MTIRHNPALALAAALAITAQAARAAEVRADFDGDGKVDRAAIETTADGWRLIATLKGRTTVLETQPGAPDGFYLKPTLPGRHGGVRLRRPAFEFGREESGAQIIYWTGKRWARIQQGD